MKKTSNIFLPVAVAILMLFCGAALLSACSGSDSSGSDTETTTNAESTTITEDTAAAGDSDYEICSGLTESIDGDVRTITTDHVTFSVPLCDTWTYDYDAEHINLYSKRSTLAERNASDGPDGGLAYIRAIDLDEVEDSYYADWGQYYELGEAGGKFYVVNFPTDVRWDMEDPQAEEEYNALADILRKDSSWITLTGK